MKYVERAALFAAFLGNSITVVSTGRWLSLVALIGLTSASSALAAKPAPPAAPSGLAATAVSSSQINLSWSDNSSNETGFKIERAPSATAAFTEIATVSASVRTYSNTGLSTSTAYYYRVRAYNSRGNSAYSNTANATTQGGGYTITTSSSPTAGGATSGGGAKASGSSVTVVATPSSCYNFVNWTQNGVVVSTSASYSFTATANRTLVANFSQISYTIFTSSSPTAGGSTSGAGSKACGTSVTVTATPNSGYNFVNWTQSGTVVSTSASYTFTASATRSLVANFAAATASYTITTGPAPTAGGACSGGGTYAGGANVTVNGTPNTGYHFVNWTENGTVVSASASYSFTASANRTLMGNFSQNTYSIVTSSSPTAGGATSGGGTKTQGSSVTVVATPSSCYNFVNWTENGSVVSTSASYTFTATANRTLVANFSQNTYTITTTCSPTAGGSAGGGGSKLCGSTVSLLATPNGGYSFVNWTENGTVVSTSASYSFTASANRTLVANFTTATAYTVTTSSSPAAGGSTSGGGSKASGSSVTVIATLNSGYSFVNWTENGVSVSTSASYSFTATASRNLVANFAGTASDWAMTMGGTGTDMGQSVATDANGNVFVAGYFNGAVNFGGGALTSAGVGDIFVAKYSAGGAHVWSKRFGGTGEDQARSLAVDRNGDVVVTGYFSGTAAFGTTTYASLAGRDVFLVKLSGAAGTNLWTKQIGGTSPALGGDDYGNGVAVDPNNADVVLVGEIQGFINFGGGMIYTASMNRDSFVVRYSAAGTYQWAKLSFHYSPDWCQTVAVDNGGNVLFAGGFIDPGLNWGGLSLSDMNGLDWATYLVKYTSAGTHVWSKSFAANGNVMSSQVAADAAGNVFLVGHAAAPINFGLGTLSLPQGVNNMFLVKFSGSNGACTWSKPLISDVLSASSGVAVDNAGNVVVAGSFQGSINLAGGTQASAGGYDVFTAKYSGSGSYLSSERFGGSGTDLSKGIGRDASGNVVMTGAASSGVSFGGVTLPSFGGYDIFLLRLAP